MKRRLFATSVVLCVSFAACKGQQGEQGPVGPQGEPGATGAAGATGPQGTEASTAQIIEIIESQPINLNASSTLANKSIATADQLLSESQVESYVTNGAIDLAAGSTLGGAPLATVAQIPGETQIETYVTNGPIDLAATSTIGGTPLASIADVPSEATVEQYVTNAALALAAGTTIGGVEPQARVSGTCPSGASIASIDASGAVTCQPTAPANVLTVGTSGAQFTSISAALAAVSNATAAQPYLIVIGPGTYPIYAASTQIPSHVQLIGMGPEVTTIETQKLVLNADTALRNLKLYLPMSAGTEIQLKSGAGTIELERVALRSTFTSIPSGNSGIVRLLQCDVETAGKALIIDFGATPRVEILRSKLKVAMLSLSGPPASGQVLAARGNGATVIVRESDLSITGGSGSAAAIFWAGADNLDVRNSTLSAKNPGGVAFVLQRDSTLKSGGTAVLSFNRLDGPTSVIASGITLKCSANTDGSDSFLASSCP